MTQSHLTMILTGAAFTGSAAMWIAAWTLCGPTGRRRMALGLDLEELARDVRSWVAPEGRHHTSRTGETPLYDGEPVRHLDRRSEDERAAEYARLRAEAVASVASVSAAPLMDFTQELRHLTISDSQPAVPSQLAALREVVRLHQELADVEADYSRRISAAIARATGNASREGLLVAA